MILSILNPNNNPIYNDGTVVLYTFIIAISTFLAYVSSKKLVLGGDVGTYKISFSLYVMSFIILFFFSAFRYGIGIDYDEYLSIYQLANLNEFSDATIEPGFYLLNLLLRKVISYKYFGFIFFSFVTIYIVFKHLFKNRKSLCVWMGVLAYISLFYFISYDLVRICFAASLLLPTHKLLEKKRYTIYSIIVILVCMIHYSSIIMVLPLFLLFLYNWNKFLFLSLYLSLIYIMMNKINLLLSLIDIERYQHYLLKDTGEGIGYAIILFHLPLLIFAFLGRKMQMGESFFSVFLVFICSSFLFSMGGYRMEIMGRFYLIFTAPFIVYVPMVLHRIKIHSKQKYYMWSLFWVGYFFIRLVLQVPLLFYSDYIMPYKSLFS